MTERSIIGAREGTMMDTMQAYPQPREGITGTPRDDDLLSLDDSSLPRRKIMVAMGYRLWRTALTAGLHAPAGREIYERMNSPRPGDLVMENSRTDPVQGIGILIEHRDEYACSDEEWVEWQAQDPGGYDRRPTDEAWYVQYGPQPDDVCRWTNATFIALPTERFSFT